MNTNGIRRQPQQARSSLKRDSILDAAQRLIYERGYGETTISDIARDAEVTKQNVYQMFANKASILEALIERKSKRIDEHNSQKLMAALPYGWRETVRAGVMAFYDLNRADPSLDPLFIASQDVPRLRQLDFEQMNARVLNVSALYADVVGLPNDQLFQDFSRAMVITSTSIVRHALHLDESVALRFLNQHIATIITRLEMMGAK